MQAEQNTEINYRISVYGFAIFMQNNNSDGGGGASKCAVDTDELH